MKNKNGFTLIEVIITLVIVAIMAAMAVPFFNSWIPKMRLKAEGRDLYSNLQKAKMEAIKRNATVNFNFTLSTGIPNACTGGGYVFTIGGVNIVNKTMANKICLTTPSVFPVGFNATGLPSGVIGKIQLTHPGTTTNYTITQTLGGGLNIQ